MPRVRHPLTGDRLALHRHAVNDMVHHSGPASIGLLTIGESTPAGYSATDIIVGHVDVPLPAGQGESFADLMALSCGRERYLAMAYLGLGGPEHMGEGWKFAPGANQGVKTQHA